MNLPQPLDDVTIVLFELKKVMQGISVRPSPTPLAESVFVYPNEEGVITSVDKPFIIISKRIGVLNTLAPFTLSKTKEHQWIAEIDCFLSPAVTQDTQKNAENQVLEQSWVTGFVRAILGAVELRKKTVVNTREWQYATANFSIPFRPNEAFFGIRFMMPITTLISLV